MQSSIDVIKFALKYDIRDVVFGFTTFGKDDKTQIGSMSVLKLNFCDVILESLMKTHLYKLDSTVP